MTTAGTLGLIIITIVAIIILGGLGFIINIAAEIFASLFRSAVGLIAGIFILILFLSAFSKVYDKYGAEVSTQPDTTVTVTK